MTRLLSVVALGAVMALLGAAPVVADEEKAGDKFDRAAYDALLERGACEEAEELARAHDPAWRRMWAEFPDPSASDVRRHVRLVVQWYFDVAPTAYPDLVMCAALEDLSSGRDGHAVAGDRPPYYVPDAYLTDRRDPSAALAITNGANGLAALARVGYAPALFELARLYDGGVVFARSPQAAFVLTEIGKKSGSAAPPALAQVSASLTPEETHRLLRYVEAYRDGIVAKSLELAEPDIWRETTAIYRRDPAFHGACAEIEDALRPSYPDLPRFAAPAALEPLAEKLERQDKIREWTYDYVPRAHPELSLCWALAMIENGALALDEAGEPRPYLIETEDGDVRPRSESVAAQSLAAGVVELFRLSYELYGPALAAYAELRLAGTVVDASAADALYFAELAAWRGYDAAQISARAAKQLTPQEAEDIRREAEEDRFYWRIRSLAMGTVRYVVPVYTWALSVRDRLFGS